jgi:hypothetical protein
MAARRSFLLTMACHHPPLMTTSTLTVMCMLPPLRIFACEMQSAAVPEAPRIYVPPESLYVKRLALLNLYTVYPFTSIW